MGFLEKGLLLYLLLALSITFAYPQAIFTGEAGQTVLNWFDVSQVNNTIVVGSNLSQEAYTATDKLALAPDTTGAVILNLFDPIFQILSWFGLIFKIIFSPVMLLGASNSGMIGAPPAIVFMIALPMVLLMIIGLVKFFRGVD